MRSMLSRGMALKSTPARSMSVSRRPLSSTSVLEAAEAPKPRMSTVVPAPLTAPNTLVVCTPGWRAMMSWMLASGERMISSEVMTEVEAPVIPTPAVGIAIDVGRGRRRAGWPGVPVRMRV